MRILSIITTLSEMLVNFEVLVNENIVAYGAMVRILKILNSTCVKLCQLIQKLELVTLKIFW